VFCADKEPVNMTRRQAIETDFNGFIQIR